MNDYFHRKSFHLNFPILLSYSPVLLCLLFLRRSLRENNLVHKEKYHHRYTTIQHCSSDIIQPVRYKHSCNCDPDAVNRIYDTGHDAECDQIPERLISNFSLASENEVPLTWKVNAFSKNHGYHVCAKVRKSTMLCIITNNIPLKCLTKHYKKT